MDRESIKKETQLTTRGLKTRVCDFAFYPFRPMVRWGFFLGHLMKGMKRVKNKDFKGADKKHI